MTRIDAQILKPGSIAARKFASAILAKWVTVTWAVPVKAAPDRYSVIMTIRDLAGNRLAQTRLIRITCTPDATLTVGARGTIVSGDNSADLILKTHSTGMVDLVVVCPTPKTVTVITGPTQGSPMLDCSTQLVVTFT